MHKYLTKLLAVFFCASIFFMGISTTSIAKKTKVDEIKQIKDIGIMVGQGKPVSEIEDAWKSYLKSQPENIPTDVALQQVLEEAMSEADRVLQRSIKKVTASDNLKKNIDDELNQKRALYARSYEESMSKSVSRSGSRSGRDSRGDGHVAESKGLGTTLGELNQYVGAVSSVLNTLATDPNLANTGVQNTLQEHQNTLQLISSVANVLYQVASPSQGQQGPLGYPSQQDPVDYPTQQEQMGYPTQQDQSGYPTQQGQMGYPTQQGQTGYPTQQGQMGYPTQQGQTGYPTQQGQTGYPTQQGQMGYPTQQGQTGYPTQQGQSGNSGQPGLMGQWQQSAYSPSLLGCWQCQTMSGPASFIFKSESLLIYNGQLANYMVIPGAFRVFEGGITVDYQYELRQNNLLVTLPDKSYIQCMRTICR